VLVSLAPSAGWAATMRVVAKERLQAILEKAFPDAPEVLVIDRGGGDHFEARVTDSSFNGLSMIDQHKLIYKALAEPWADGTIHELRIRTKGVTDTGGAS